MHDVTMHLSDNKLFNRIENIIIIILRNGQCLCNLMCLSDSEEESLENFQSLREEPLANKIIRGWH